MELIGAFFYEMCFATPFACLRARTTGHAMGMGKHHSPSRIILMALLSMALCGLRGHSVTWGACRVELAIASLRLYSEVADVTIV